MILYDMNACLELGVFEYLIILIPLQVVAHAEPAGYAHHPARGHHA